MALTDFPLVTAATIMVATTLWMTSVHFGHLLSSVAAMPGAGSWKSLIWMWAGATTISITALVFVDWGISPVDYLISKALHLRGFFIYRQTILSLHI